jgi:predicted PurR-regulated permease PerM
MTDKPDHSRHTTGDLESSELAQSLDHIHADAAAQAGASLSRAFGNPGPAFDHRAPFFVGFLGALGAILAVTLAWLIVIAGQVLVLIGVAFFIAVGLDPVVAWISRRGLPRWAALIVVLASALALFAAFLALAIPVVTKQAADLANHIPHYLHSLNERNSTLGKLNTKYHIESSLQKLLTGGASFTGAVGVGKVILDFLGEMVLLIVVSIYLLADFPRVKRGIYQLAPKSRRPRMILLTDGILARIGGYVLGNLFTSLVAGVGTFLWTLILGVPYSLLLGMLVALLDLIPIVGSTVGGVIVALVALTVSPTLAIATVAFYFLYRFLEDYLLTPRVMMRTVEVPGLVTVIATIIGGTLLGIVGALIAIPIAAAIKLLYDEIATPHLDKS